MTQRLRLICLLLVAALVVALSVLNCKGDAPQFSACISGHVEVDGKSVYAESSSALGAGCTDPKPTSKDATLLDLGATPRFIALISAPAGPWQLSVSAQGALTTSTGSAVSVSFNSSGLGDASTAADLIPVIVPLKVVSPFGTATVQVIVGQTTRTFQFFIDLGQEDAVPPCILALGGLAGAGGADTSTCDTGFTGASVDGSAGATNDPILLPITQPVYPHYAGEQVYILARANDFPDFGMAGAGDELAPGQSLTATLTSSGSLSLLGDGGLTKTEPVTFQHSALTSLLPAQFTGTGPSAIALRLPSGAQARNVYTSGEPMVAARQVEKSGSTRIVTVCTSPAQGTVTAALVNNQGKLLTPTVGISTADPRLCPPALSLAGQATFVWSGSSKDDVVWSFSLGSAGGNFVQAIPMNAAPASVSPNSCLGAMGGALLAWTVGPPPIESVPDSGELMDGGFAVKTLIVDMQVTLDDCKGDTLAGGQTIVVTGTGGFVPTPPTVTLDSKGRAVFELRGPAATNCVSALLGSSAGASVSVSATSAGVVSPANCTF